MMRPGWTLPLEVDDDLGILAGDENASRIVHDVTSVVFVAGRAGDRAQDFVGTPRGIGLCGSRRLAPGRFARKGEQKQGKRSCVGLRKRTHVGFLRDTVSTV